MKRQMVQAVVLPVFEKYLAVLLERQRDFTTMVWGWQGNAKRMAAPERLLGRQGYVPFLLRSLETTGHVTHAAISGLIVHQDSRGYQQVASWLRERRVEIYAHAKFGDKARTFYAVTAGYQLPSPIPFHALTLASEGRPLDPGMVRGYAIVLLPDLLSTWYERAVQTWDSLEAPAIRGAV